MRFDGLGVLYALRRRKKMFYCVDVIRDNTRDVKFFDSLEEADKYAQHIAEPLSYDPWGYSHSTTATVLTADDFDAAFTESHGAVWINYANTNVVASYPQSAA
jgi:hypothetical protein